MLKVGFLINPVSGLGGSVGLKGTDGPEIIKKALIAGAEPKAAERALMALKALLPIKERFILYTPQGLMGEFTALEAGITPVVLTGVCGNASGRLTDTTRRDTADAAEAMLGEVDLLIFAGGDGTARDVMDAVGSNLVVIGIPAGVKMHSAVFTVTPRAAGELAYEYLEGRIHQTVECEVMDIDETAFRDGMVSASLYGYMTIPLNRSRFQGGKVASSGDLQATKAIGCGICEGMLPGWLYIIGPGSTTAAVMEALDLPNTLLGVDLVKDRQLIVKDAGEKEILAQLEKNENAKIIVTPIGGQACLFGRGNQQISSHVISKVGKENIIIVATKAKIQSFYGKSLLVDTGVDETDQLLRGYYRIRIAYRQETVLPVG